MEERKGRELHDEYNWGEIFYGGKTGFSLHHENYVLRHEEGDSIKTLFVSKRNIIMVWNNNN